MQPELPRRGLPIENSPETAEELRRSGDFAGAAAVYSKIWPNGDPRSGWGFALCLRKIKRTTEAIQVAAAVFELAPSFRLGRSVYAWALFDEIRKVADLTDDAIQKARLIVKLCLPDEARYMPVSPFVPTVLQMSRLLLEKGRYDRALRSLALLHESRLTSEERVVTDGAGKQRRLASQRERYFALKTSALEKLNRWGECLDVSESALSECGRLHHDNDIWFARRAALAKSHLGRNDEAIDELTKLAARKPAPFIFADIAKVAWRSERIDVVLTHSLKALLAKGDLVYKLPAILLLARVLWRRGDWDHARSHLALYVACRKEHEWPVRAEAQALAEEWGFGEPEPATSSQLLQQLRPIWRSWAGESDDRLAGTVQQLLPHGKAGFIMDVDKHRYYFDARDWKDRRRKPTPGSRVTFKTKPSFDRKHQRESMVACDIVGAA